jgi:hypothetical protein
MSGFPILDLVAGMIFIYFMLSIVCSSAVEIILTFMNARAAVLAKWLKLIFDKEVAPKINETPPINLGQAIMDHCSVTALSGKKQSPSYIDAKNFTSALLEQVAFANPDKPLITDKIDDVINIIKTSTVLSTEFQRVLLTYAYEAKATYEALSQKTMSEIDLFRNKIENWYDSSMDRLGEFLRMQYTRRITFVLAMIIAVALNADSIAIAKYLYNNPETRAKLAAQAYAAAKSDSMQTLVNRIKAARALNKKDSLTVQQLQDTVVSKARDIKIAYQSLSGSIPFGWTHHDCRDEKDNVKFSLVLSKICGLLGTFLAIMLGAPFWFDLLNKIADLRGSGKKPAESPKLTKTLNQN